MSLNATPEFASITGELSKPVSLEYQTTSLKAISVVIETLKNSFNNEMVSIEVSNDRQNWMFLKEITLGAKDSINFSITHNNQSVFGSPLHFHFIRFSVPAIEDVAVKIVCSGR